jgi:cation diffusion facilitator CzcD-associated flavoprotein CzcO
VQIVGAVVDTVAELHLFQRTAQWILPVPNNPVTDDEKERYRSDPSAMRAVRDELSRSFTENFANAVVDASSPQMKLLEELCRANLEGSVADPELRERLRPNYRAACKRLVISPNFYTAIQRPNAHLVTDGIERVERGGVRTADGRLHEVDVLVLATGFRVDRFMRPIEVVGRGGVALDTVWAKRPSAYLSVSIPEFPNLFMLNGPNGPVGNFSLIDVAELQFDYIMQLIEPLASGNWKEVSATRGAAERFEADRVEAAKNTVWVTGCRSWYLDDRGIPAVWPWSFDRFREEMSRPRLDDYQLVR